MITTVQPAIKFQKTKSLIFFKFNFIMCRHFIAILSIFINALFTLEARFVGSSGTKYRRDGRQLSRFAVRGSKAYSEI